MCCNPIYDKTNNSTMFSDKQAIRDINNIPSFIYLENEI